MRIQVLTIDHELRTLLVHKLSKDREGSEMPETCIRNVSILPQKWHYSSSRSATRSVPGTIADNQALRAENVDYVVAPYEADAQLCFLEREGYVDGIITEDSDLLVFGCRHVIFKLEGNGQCVSIKAEKLALVNTFPMHGWTDVQFRRMAVSLHLPYTARYELIIRCCLDVITLIQSLVLG
jgi:hypothetical protein